MIVNLNGKKYIVSWRHIGSFSPIGTDCSIREATSETDSIVVAEGFSEIGAKDHHVKNIGRKVSMAKALFKIFPGTETTDAYNRSVRRRFWNV